MTAGTEVDEREQPADAVQLELLTVEVDQDPVAEPEPAVDVATPAPSVPTARRGVLRAALAIFAALVLGIAADLLIVGQLRHYRDQRIGYAEIRGTLAKGTAPVGQAYSDGRLLPLGTPVAVLEIPRIGMREVVREGTTSGVLRSGAGHRRDTVLPGQIGTSLVMGRHATYGGPFRRIHELEAGDTITVTTGQGRHRYRVLGPRHAGDPVPPAQERADGRPASRLTLMTAAGSALLPTGLLRVDADLDAEGEKPSNPKVTPPKRIAFQDLPAAELPMAGDPSAWLLVVFWGQALVCAAIATAWLLRRWGRLQSWIVALPVLAALGLAVADQVARLLPNLL